MRLLVCGGRSYDDRERLFAALDLAAAKCGMSTLIHGGARGADRLAGEWAAARRIQETVYPAGWTEFGRRAGPIRNQRMLDDGRPDGVVAFPGGAGTADMIRRANAAGLPVWRPYG